MEESSTTLKALVERALYTGEPEDARALIDAWKGLCAVLDAAYEEDYQS